MEQCASEELYSASGAPSRLLQSKENLPSRKRMVGDSPSPDDVLRPSRKNNSKHVFLFFINFKITLKIDLKQNFIKKSFCNFFFNNYVGKRSKFFKVVSLFDNLFFNVKKMSKFIGSIEWLIIC